MNKTVLICALSSSITLLGAAEINVSVCNLGQVPETVMAQAEDEAAGVFRSIGVEVVWHGCGEGPVAQQAAANHWFTFRLRNDLSPRMAGGTSLDAMGRAFVSADTAGYLADAYYGTVQLAAGANGTDTAALLGCVMAHELGHLLLGPGHIPSGIMRAGWKAGDLDAVRKRWLKFNRAQAARIHAVLQVSTTGN